MRSVRRFVFACFVFAACGAGGCSTFDAEWKAASASQTRDDIAGVWSGTWTSEFNGHAGALHGVFTKTAPQRYKLRFYATWANIFGGEFDVEVDAAREGATWKLKGERDLGTVLFHPLGVYKFDGSATAERFQSKYTSAEDHGVFELRRVEMPAPK